CFFIPFLADGQGLSFSIHWGDSTATSGKSRWNLAGADRSGAYALKYRIKSSTQQEEPYSLEWYDKYLSLTRSFKLKELEGKNDDKLENMIMVKGKKYIVWSGQSDVDEILLYARPITDPERILEEDTIVLSRTILPGPAKDFKQNH